MTGDVIQLAGLVSALKSGGVLDEVGGSAGVILSPDSEDAFEPGLEVDRRGAQLLVGNGDCEPVDDEAEEACKGWKLKRSEVLLSRDMLAKAIEPEDRDRYRRGEILGYDENGNDIPGPNCRPKIRMNRSQKPAQHPRRPTGAL